MARYDDLNTNMIAYWAVLSIVILVLILQGTQALCYNMVNMVDSSQSKRMGSEADKPTLVKREQIESLRGYRKERVLDEAAPPPEKGKDPATKEVIYIPIDEAQKLIQKEYGAPAPAGA